MNVNCITNVVKQRLKEQNMQKWWFDIVNSFKGHIFQTFKLPFGYEKYLNILSSIFQKVCDRTLFLFTCIHEIY